MLQDVTLSVAGMLLLVLHLLRSEWAGLAVGKRLWKDVQSIGVLMLCAAALLRPGDFKTAMGTFTTEVSHDAQREFGAALTKAFQPALPKATAPGPHTP